MRFKQFITENEELKSRLRAIGNIIGRIHADTVGPYLGTDKITDLRDTIGAGTHYRLRFIHPDHLTAGEKPGRPAAIESTKQFLDQRNIKYEFSHDEGGRPTFYVPKNQTVSENFGPHNRSTNIDTPYLRFILSQMKVSDIGVDRKSLPLTTTSANKHKGIGENTHHKISVIKGHIPWLPRNHPFGARRFPDIETRDREFENAKNEMVGKAMKNISTHLSKFGIKNEYSKDEEDNHSVYVPVDQS